MRCSIRVQERSAEEFSLTIRDAEKPAEVTDSKRRKLSHKQPPTEAYQNQEVWNQRVDQFLKVAIDHAPRVGKRFLSNGDLLRQAQTMFPECRIQWIELCKGADRYRSPPPNVT